MSIVSASKRSARAHRVLFGSLDRLALVGECLVLDDDVDVEGAMVIGARTSVTR